MSIQRNRPRQRSRTRSLWLNQSKPKFIQRSRPPQRPRLRKRKNLSRLFHGRREKKFALNKPALPKRSPSPRTDFKASRLGLRVNQRPTLSPPRSPSRFGATRPLPS